MNFIQDLCGRWIFVSYGSIFPSARPFVNKESHFIPHVLFCRSAGAIPPLVFNIWKHLIVTFIRHDDSSLLLVSIKGSTSSHSAKPFCSEVIDMVTHIGNEKEKMSKTQGDQDKENRMATMNRYAFSLPFVFYKKKSAEHCSI
jgi:hypothetical protein